MLLEDKELKKSISLQLKKVRGWAFAKRNQKTDSKNHGIFQSKILLRKKTLGLHFQIGNPTFFLSLTL